MNKNFAITGTAGFVAPRHLKAIKETGSDLIAALDPFDSVGVLDSFFPEAMFFTEFERFDRYIDKKSRNGQKKRLDYLTICSPNYLHDAHIRFALRNGADAICEKPLVLNPWNLDALQEIEKETGKNVFTILQLRVHPSIIALKSKIESEKRDKKYEVELTYITSRGKWYDYSWKGIEEKSGGIGTNIGVHFFDLLTWLFGKVEKNDLYLREERRMSGFLELKNANVKWYLSLEKEDLPDEVKEKNVRTFRSIQIDGNEVEFSDGFTDLHTRVYENTLAGNGFTIDDARPSIELVYSLRHQKIANRIEEPHPFLKNNKGIG